MIWLVQAPVIPQILLLPASSLTCSNRHDEGLFCHWALATSSNYPSGKRKAVCPCSSPGRIYRGCRVQTSTVSLKLYQMKAKGQKWSVWLQLWKWIMWVDYELDGGGQGNGWCVHWVQVYFLLSARLCWGYIPCDQPLSRGYYGNPLQAKWKKHFYYYFPTFLMPASVIQEKQSEPNRGTVLPSGRVPSLTHPVVQRVHMAGVIIGWTAFVFPVHMLIYLWCFFIRLEWWLMTETLIPIRTSTEREWLCIR